MMMTEQLLEAITTNIARSQAETSRLLIENRMASHRGSFSDVSTPVPATSRLGSFAKCTARFDGTAATGFNEADVLEAFIDAVQTYKECINVRDEHALKGPPMLLTSNAAIWWRSVKSSTATWDDALRHQPKETKNCDLRPASDAEPMKVDTSLLTLREGEGRCDLRPASDAELMKVDTSLLTLREGEGRCDLRPASDAELMKVDTPLLTLRELRAPADVLSDMRAIVESDNVVTSLTPYLKRLTTVLFDAREIHEKKQALQKRNADEGRRPAPEYAVGDLVLLRTQGANDAGRGQTPKFIPKRDGPYRIKEAVSLTTYILETLRDSESIGKYHVSQLTPFVGEVQPPVKEKKRRGRPRKLDKIQ